MIGDEIGALACKTPQPFNSRKIINGLSCVEMQAKVCSKLNK